MVDIGPRTELNVFEVPGDGAADLPRGSMFGHGPIDHMGLQAMDRDAFVEIRRRLVARGATTASSTDFGRAHSVFFRDPDGLEGEVLLWISHDAEVHPPGTPATGYPACSRSRSQFRERGPVAEGLIGGAGTTAAVLK